MKCKGCKKRVNEKHLTNGTDCPWCGAAIIVVPEGDVPEAEDYGPPLPHQPIFDLAPVILRDVLWDIYKKGYKPGDWIGRFTSLASYVYSVSEEDDDDIEVMLPHIERNIIEVVLNDPDDPNGDVQLYRRERSVRREGQRKPKVKVMFKRMQNG